jgi:histone deacetylase HOS3
VIAHLRHKINRVVVFDIDLHHGNGTQSIVWGINEETFRAEVETQGEEEGGNAEGASAGGQKTPPKLKVYYGSIHDVMSFPCEVSVDNAIVVNHSLNVWIYRTGNQS